MKLDLFNNLIKENNAVQNFIKELSEFLEKSNPRKEQSLIQELQDQNKLTTKYRDKMYIERSNILNDYAKETADKGDMYYIYNKDLEEEDTYYLCICKEENSHDVITVKESNLPKGAGVDSVLRIKNGEYILDKEATEEVCKEMKKMANRLLKEQSKEIEECRIEGHFYEVVEVLSNKIWLMDRSENNGIGFEELNFQEENFKVKEGDMLQYINGEYKLQ